jgi:peptide deformylase
MEGDPLLRRKSKPVKSFDSKLGELLDDMKETMVAANGIGIAAPQVGVLKRAVIVTVNDQQIELVNPEIVESEGVQSANEGCLSVPGKYGLVERPLRVKATAFNRNGNPLEIEAEEYIVHIICHEIDHLDGILFTDKAISVSEAEEPDSELETAEGEDEGQAAERAGAQADAYADGKVD